MSTLTATRPSSSVVAVGADTISDTNELLLPTADTTTTTIDSTSSRSRFSHTKALFEHLEKANNQQLPSFYSPDIGKRTLPHRVAPVVDTRTTTSCTSSPRRSPPPLPPKPRLATNITDSSLNNTRPATTSPLTEMSRHFTDLVSDLERLSTSPVGRTVPANGYPRITQTLKYSPPPPALTKPSSLYEPYWRQNSWYKQRIVHGGSMIDPPPIAPPSVPTSSIAAQSSRVQTNGGAGTATTTYAVVRSRKPDSGGDDLEMASSRDSAIGSSEATIDDNHSDIKAPLANKVLLAEGKKRWSQCSIESAAEMRTGLQLSPTNKEDVSSSRDDGIFYEMLPDGNYVMYVEGLSPDQPSTTTTTMVGNRRLHSSQPKVSFSSDRIKVYTTHSVEDYDRRNDDIDPVSSSAEYELERRLDKMDIFDVQLNKGAEGLGFSIIGMGVGADSGLEKLGIFVKCITPGGAVHRDGRIRVCDQIVSVDGQSLVGVSQMLAADALRSTNGVVKFTIGRERDLENSEIAMLIRQSLEQDRVRSNADEAWKMSDQTQSSLVSDDVRPMEYGNGDESAIGSLDESMDVPQMDQVMHQLRQAFRECEQAADMSSNRNNFCKPSFAHVDARIVVNHHQQSNGISSSAESSPSGSRRSIGISVEEREIRAKIGALQSELENSDQKSVEMQTVLGESRQQYQLLEKKYEKAKQLLKDYQEREKDLLEREESHVFQLREKDMQYSVLVTQLKQRINELEEKLDEMAAKRTSLVETQLSDLKEQLKVETNKRKDRLKELNITTTTDGKGVDASPAAAYKPSAATHSTGSADDDSVSTADIGVPTTDRLDNTAAKTKVNVVKQSQIMCGRQLPSSAKRHETEVMIMCHHTEHCTHQIGAPDAPPHDSLDSSSAPSSSSPIGRVSEPASNTESPVMPRKAAAATSPHRLLFPLKRRYIHKNGFGYFHDGIDGIQALEVLHWSCDDVCQLLVQLGLEKYTPEFTINRLTGFKFLDLDGNKLKAIGIQNHSDRSLIKKCIKELRGRIEKERKAIEKESRLKSKRLSATNNNNNHHFLHNHR